MCQPPSRYLDLDTTRPKVLLQLRCVLAPGTSTVCCAENYITKTNSGSVIRIGKRNGGEDKCSRRRLRDPAISAVCCSQNNALTSVQRSANCDTVVHVSERNPIKASSCTACLCCPTASAIRRSDDRPIFTDGRPSIYIGERDSKKESGCLLVHWPEVPKLLPPSVVLKISAPSNASGPCPTAVPLFASLKEIPRYDVNP